MEREKILIGGYYTNQSRSSHYLIINVNKDVDSAFAFCCDTGVVDNVSFSEIFERCSVVISLKTDSFYWKYEGENEGGIKNG